MNNSQMGEKILEGLGGPENISHFTHCATRLRVTPKSNGAINKDAIEKVPGVLSIIEQSGQTQVVLGDKVEGVYNEMLKLPGMNNLGAGGATAGHEENKPGVLTRVFDVLSDSFRPLLWALLGTSMILTLIVFLQQFGYFGTYTDLTGKVVNVDIVNGPRFTDPEAVATMLNEWRAAFPFWFILLAAALSVLQFMPIMVGATAAKRLGANMWVGAAIPAALMTDTFRGLVALAGEDKVLDVPFLGMTLPLYDVNYTGQIFPPLLAAALLAPLERLLKKVIPTMLHMVFVPMLSVMILVPVTAFLVGPIGVNVAKSISGFIGGVNETMPWLVGGLIAGLYLFMVPLGLHWPLNAVMINNLQAVGTDFIQSPMGAYNFAVFGLVTGVAIRARRNKELRQTATGAAVSGLLGGISEPSLYGVVLRYKRVFPLILIPAIIGGALISSLGVKSYAFAFTSLISIPAMQPSHLYALGLAVAFFGAMAGVLVFGYESKGKKGEEAVAERAEAEVPVAATAAVAGAATGTAAAATPWASEAGADLVLTSPLEGKAIPLSEVPDPIFAAAKLGKGAAIVPTGNTVVAPAAGKVSATMASGHAVGLKLDNGVELLIHVGIDTVNLEGKGFEVHVTKGQQVSAGDKLLTFDPAVIEAAGYPLVTPVLVTNTAKFADVEGETGAVTHGDKLLTITTL